ncbi:DUF4331 family protein, partial [Okeania hirsuta]
MASSHREAPLIADDPLADNVDLYAFRSPINKNSIEVPYIADADAFAITLEPEGGSENPTLDAM